MIKLFVHGKYPQTDLSKNLSLWIADIVLYSIFYRHFRKKFFFVIFLISVILLMLVALGF